MLNQEKIKKSYGMMRLSEVLRDESERREFEKALENITAVYYENLRNFNTRNAFDNLKMSKYREMAKCLKDISLICTIAQKNKIYLDRPNDDISYFIYLASKYYNKAYI